MKKFVLILIFTCVVIATMADMVSYGKFYVFSGAVLFLLTVLCLFLAHLYTTKQHEKRELEKEIEKLQKEITHQSEVVSLFLNMTYRLHLLDAIPLSVQDRALFDPTNRHVVLLKIRSGHKEVSEKVRKILFAFVPEYGMSHLKSILAEIDLLAQERDDLDETISHMREGCASVMESWDTFKKRESEDVLTLLSLTSETHNQVLKVRENLERIKEYSSM
jgi:uncharacterized protein (DUF58 family)